MEFASDAERARRQEHLFTVVWHFSTGNISETIDFFFDVAYETKNVFFFLSYN